MGFRNITEQQIMEHVKHVQCKRAFNCLNNGKLEACWRCHHNKNGIHRQDNYMPKIKGMKFF